jgi:protein STE50
MLKHIKDIRSPIVVAQQKHAARKASSAISSEGTVGNTTPGHTKSPSQRTIHRPPKLEVNDLSTPAPSGLSPQPAWPEPGIASPMVDPTRVEDVNGGPPVSAGMQSISHNSTHLNATGSTLMPGHNGHDSTRSRGSDSGEPPSSNGSGREIPPAPASGISYAVAIYPYMAEQDDEFDVVV